MNKNQTMISAAMLEAVWQSRSKDMIDLITPFVMYATAKLTSPGEIINTQEVQKYVQTNYAYPDMPEIIVKKVLARNPYSCIQRVNHKFRLVCPIDDEISRMDSRKKECETYLNILGEKLSEYLNDHCKKSSKFSADKAIDCLHSFFSRYGLQVGTDDLASINISPKDYESDYYIARFIFMCKDKHNQEYEYLNDLIKGYFLRLAIYIQPENSNLKSASYSNTTFFYDTPFLLDLLGYCGTERKNNAELLHDMLKRQNGKFGYFPHIKQEIIDILYAYKFSLNPLAISNSYRTLDGLNAQNYNSADVDREITILSSKLESIFGIIEHNVPPYDVKDDGSVDERKILDEEKLKQYIRDNTPHYTDDNLENDVKSALAIHRLRGDNISNNIESCGYIFVTNNRDFIKAFNIYYKENIKRRAFQITISDSYLSAITWIKCGLIDKLPENELLKNAYSALQPMPEIMKKVDEVLQKLKQSGQLTPEQVVVLRASRVFQDQLWSNSFGEVGSINEASVQEAQKKYQEQLIADERERHEYELMEKDKQYQMKLNQLSEKTERTLKQHALAEEQQRKMQFEKNRKAADSYAKEKREKRFFLEKTIFYFIAIFLFISCALGTILSFKMYSNIPVSIIFAISTIVSIISIFDTIFARKRNIIKLLEKWANQYETKVRERKLEEYNSLTQTKKSN